MLEGLASFWGIVGGVCGLVVVFLSLGLAGTRDDTPWEYRGP